jgi:hypothetical protein
LLLLVLVLLLVLLLRQVLLRIVRIRRRHRTVRPLRHGVHHGHGVHHVRGPCQVRRRRRCVQGWLLLLLAEGCRLLTEGAASLSDLRVRSLRLFVPSFRGHRCRSEPCWCWCWCWCRCGCHSGCIHLRDSPSELRSLPWLRHAATPSSPPPHPSPPKRTRRVHERHQAALEPALAPRDGPACCCPTAPAAAAAAAAATPSRRVSNSRSVARGVVVVSTLVVFVTVDDGRCIELVEGSGEAVQPREGLHGAPHFALRAPRQR